MAQVKIYQAAYVYEETDDAQIYLSGWVQADGIDEVLATLPHSTPSEGEELALLEPTVLGWEEKELDTEPL